MNAMQAVLQSALKDETQVWRPVAVRKGYTPCEACGAHVLTVLQAVCSTCGVTCCTTCLQQKHKGHNWYWAENFEPLVADDLVECANGHCKHPHFMHVTPGELYQVGNEQEKHGCMMCAARGLVCNTFTQRPDNVPENERFLQVFDEACLRFARLFGNEAKRTKDKDADDRAADMELPKRRFTDRTVLHYVAKEMHGWDAGYVNEMLRQFVEAGKIVDSPASNFTEHKAIPDNEPVYLRSGL